MNTSFVFLALEAALRAAVGAFVVGCGLRLLRVRNVPVQKAAWGMVLAAALAMPLAMRWHWLPAAVSLPLPNLHWMPAAAAPAAPRAVAPPAPQASATPDAFFDSRVPEVVAPSRRSASPPRSRRPELSAAKNEALAQIQRAELGTIPAPEAPAASPAELPAHPSPAPAWTPLLTPHRLTVAGEALSCAVSLVLLVRLFCGLGAALWLWLKAEPIRKIDGLDSAWSKGVRSSRQLAAPVNVGSGVLLPADYAHWDAEKLRIVLAHERAHIRQGDFYLQALAGLYAALFWFSPLGWWLKRKLTDLGEAISDRAGLDEAASGSSYAQLLLEFAAQPRPTLIGVAMARRSNLSHRIERLLNETHFRHAFAGSRRRALLVVSLVSAVLFASTAVIRVQAAATNPAPQTPAQETEPQAPVTGQSNPEAVPAAPAAQATPAAPASPEAAPTPASSGVQVDVHARHIDIPAIHVEVPARHIEVPAVHVDVPAKHIDIPAIHVDVPARHINIPAVHFDQQAQHIDIPAIHFDQPAEHVDLPAIQIDQPAQHIDVPATSAETPGPGASNNSGYRYLFGSSGALYAMNSAANFPGFSRVKGAGRAMIVEAAPQDQSFDRTLTLNGKAELNVGTGSGNIHFTKGAAGQVKIHGIVHAGEGASADEVNQIIANPPIEQNGNTIRVGDHNMNNIGMRHISISYEIEAPADTALSAATGSGNIVDEGVGADAKLTTGSGSINATGISGDYKITTGSGSIHLEHTGSGDGKAQTGSGSIDIQGVEGGLNAMTGSGGIKATGTPSQPWKLMTGSGSIELWAGNAPMNLDASVGSGSIHTDHELTTEGTPSPHHVVGKINGGGTEVRVEAGSGNITVH